MKHVSMVLGIVLVLLARVASAESRVIDSMDALSFTPPKEKGKVELVDGKDGKALKFSFDADCRGVYAFGKAKGAPDWDAAGGFSFWVKGDGSDHLGGIEMVWDNDFSVRYGFAFPIDGTEWKKIVVAWRDLIPETCPTQRGGQTARPGRKRAVEIRRDLVWEMVVLARLRGAFVQNRRHSA